MGNDIDNATPAEQRRLAAIMFTDIVGFSRQMGADEARTLRLLATHNQIIQQAVIVHKGAVIKTVGDAFLVDFPSVVHAVQCAQQIQQQFRAYNVEKEQSEQIHVRIGIHLGDIVQQEGDVFGDGVNVASRLQGLAEPDTICISQKVYEEVENKLSLGAVIPLGKPKLKNIVQRFEVYLLLPEPPQGLRHRFQVQRLKLSRRARPAHLVVVAGLVLIAVTVVAVRYLPFLFPSTQHPTPSTQAALPLPDKPSIVVLPFTNMSEDPKQEYFSDGITEDLTSDLSRISSLFVIARNSAFTYKGKAVKVQDVSREMGVRYVLEGSVRKSDNQVRVTAQLIDATTGGHLWTERYDRPLKDIFALQDEVVQKIVTTLKLQLTVMEQGFLVRKHTNNLEAYDVFLRGMEYLYRFTKEANAQARQMFEKAVALDLQYAEAYARLGLTYYLERAWRWSADLQTLERSLALAQQAVALDNSLPITHSLLSILYAEKQQYDQAIAEGEQAIALDPNNADSYAWQADALWRAGRPEEAPRMVKQALRLRSNVVDYHLINIGAAYDLAGKPEEAIAPLRQYLARYPNILGAHLTLAAVYSELGKEAEARAETAEVLRLNPKFSLEVHKERVPIKDPALLERHIAALRKAGLK